MYAAMFMAAMFLVSCDNNSDLQGTETEEEQTLESASIGEEASDDALEIAYQSEAQLVSAGGRLKTSLCAEITKDEVSKIIIIDFGDGCVGPRGRTRKGKIFIAYSNMLGDSLANRIITFENYFVNNKSITGTIELRDRSINQYGNLQSVKRLIDLTITFPNGRSIVFNGSRMREWLSGSGDGDPSNNVYRITGSLEGISSTGRLFTHTIVEPIIADWSCAAQGNFARVSGVVEMTKLNGYSVRKRTVDYGDGACDNVITITTFKRTYVITTDN